MTKQELINLYKQRIEIIDICISNLKASLKIAKEEKRRRSHLLKQKKKFKIIRKTYLQFTKDLEDLNQ